MNFFPVSFNFSLNSGIVDSVKVPIVIVPFYYLAKHISLPKIIIIYAIIIALEFYGYYKNTKKNIEISIVE